MKKSNMNLSLKIICLLLFTGVCYADRGEEVYSKVCSKCHEAYIPVDKVKKNFLEDNNTLLKLKAPTISQISYSMKKKIGDPSADADIRRMEVSAFIADYIIYPDKEKSVLPPYVEKYFDTMPSLKGKLNTEDIEAISNYVYDYDKKITDHKSIHYERFDTAYEKAKKEDKIIIIKATAPRCRYCAKMDRELLIDKEVVNALKKDFIVVSIDV
ncbi:MAG: hypothetical protein DSZ08_03545, partial [Sulfurovum sp.]